MNLNMNPPPVELCCFLKVVFIVSYLFVYLFCIENVFFVYKIICYKKYDLPTNAMLIGFHINILSDILL